MRYDSRDIHLMQDVGYHQAGVRGKMGPGSDKAQVERGVLTWVGRSATVS